MNSAPFIHHASQSVSAGSLEVVLEIYTSIFDCEIIYRPENGNRWVMVAQKQTDFAIQLIEIDDKPIQDLQKKKHTHIAFISGDPSEIIKKVGDLAKARSVEFTSGAWTEKELFFDLPKIFVNSVIEVMHTSVAEK